MCKDELAVAVEDTGKGDVAVGEEEARKPDDPVGGHGKAISIWVLNDGEPRSWVGAKPLLIVCKDVLCVSGKEACCLLMAREE